MSDRASVLADIHQNMLNSAEAGEAIRNRCLFLPVINGPLAVAGLELASFLSATSSLHKAKYLVVCPRTMAGFSAGETKWEALHGARVCVEQLGGPLRVRSMLLRVEREIVDKRNALQKERDAERIVRVKTAPAEKLPSIPRRRKRVFDASDGKCHYCATPLDLTGKWHIEHKMPRALFGSNEPSNLVASCVPCNLSKRDKTDQEFIAQRRANA